MGYRRLRPWLVAFAFALTAASGARAQDFSQAHITGHIGGDTADSLGTGRVDADIDCIGTPICIGTYLAQVRDTGCTNTFTLTDRLTFTGFDLSRLGTFGGTVTLANANYDDQINADGTCSIRLDRPRGDLVVSYSATWDGSAGTLTVTSPDNPSKQFLGTFKADVTAPPPVFPMVVSTTIANGVVSSTANMQFRAQDTSTPQNVYVFAMAPITEVVNPVKSDGLKWFFQPTAKDTPVECVLAQLSASGQLVGVSPSTMIAFLANVLGSQSVAVTIVNGVPTVKIGGATFFVGYGTSSTSMVNNGVNRSAVTIPGTQVCQPQAPQTGWWWNPAEDGRGFSIEKHGNNFFFASFLYDVSGRSTWYVSTGPASLEGSLYVGDLLSAKGGQTLGGDYPGFPTINNEGRMTLTFNSATNGTLIWPGGTVPIQRLAFVPNGLALQPMANQPENGWWWNDQESGRGFFLEWQGNALDVAGYMYDDQGNPVWYLTVANMQGADNRGFTSSWWSFANGETLTGPWKPNTRVTSDVAPVTIQFTGTDTAIMTLPNGRTTNLKRQRF